MNKKKLLTVISLIVAVLIFSVISVKMAGAGPVYDGRGTDLVALYENPSAYDNANADSPAAVIVNENNEMTTADNVVYSVVFNFRGYDTLGESIILFAAITGTMVILKRFKPERGEA